MSPAKSKRRSAFMQSARCLPDFNQSWIFSTGFHEKVPRIKFQGNSSSRRSADTSGRTDRENGGHDEGTNRFSRLREDLPPPQKKNLLLLTTCIIDSTNLVCPMDVSTLCAVIMIPNDPVLPQQCFVSSRQYSMPQT